MRTATTILTVALAALIVLGCITLYSALVVDQEAKFYAQMRYLGLGMVGCVSLALIDYRRWKQHLAWVAWLGVTALLVLVFVPGFGKVINGSRSWVALGGIQFQPSEFARLALIIALAAYADRYQRKMNTFKHGVLGTALIAGPVLALIMAGKDYGNTVAIGAVVATMVFIAGVRWLHLAAVAPLVLAVMIAAVIFTPHRMNRVRAYIDPQTYAETTAMQNNRAEQALIAGGVWGSGVAANLYKMGSRSVPLYFSDFIFTVLGAEGGLVATLLTAALFLTLVLCGIYIAWHARDLFGLLLATGISVAIALQAFVHMGVVTGIIPNTGFPLPFISHGGTNLLVNLAAMGLLFSVGRHGVAGVKEGNPFERHVEVPVAEAA